MKAFIELNFMIYFALAYLVIRDFHPRFCIVMGMFFSGLAGILFIDVVWELMP